MTQKPRTYAGDLDALRHSPAFAHLVSQSRWVTWEWVWDAKNHKWTKPPLRPHGLTNAEVDNPATWGGFDLACDSVRARRCDGIGITLLGAGIGAVDLDRCRDPQTGAIEPWAQELVDQSGGAYRETTVSGTGLRLIGRTEGGYLQRRFNNGNGTGIEVYRNCPRYITVSGFEPELGPGDLPNIDLFLDALVARLDSEKASRSSQNGKQGCFTADGKIDLNRAERQENPENADNSRSGEFNQLVWQLAAGGLSLEDIIKQIEHGPAAERYVHEGRLAGEAERCYDKWREKRRQQVLGTPIPPSPPPPPGAAQGQGQSGPQPKPWPTIYVYPDELPRVLTEAEQALIILNRLYQRGSFIVKPAEQRIHVHGEPARYLLEMSVDGMRDYFTRSARFLYRDARTKTGWKPDACSYDIARGYLSRQGEWKLPVLEGISSVPLIRADGTILDVPGYDPPSGILYNPGTTKYPSMSYTPTKQDALEALQALKGYLRHFPFVPQLDEDEKPTGLYPSMSVALSGFLSAIHRRTLISSPLHGFSAPGAGHGKGLLVDAISMVLTGDTAAGTTYRKDEEENEKRLGSALIGDPQIIFFDNVSRPLEGDFFNMMLTQRSAMLRILGKSKTVRVLTSTFMCATGINLSVTGRGGMRRRMIISEIDAKTDRPEYREFPGPPLLEVISAERGKIVIAILTILRAWRLARATAGVHVTPLGSFEDWSACVREALIWLGEADPCATTERLQQGDAQRDLILDVLAQWEEVLKFDVPYTAEEIIQIATGMTPNRMQALNLNLSMSKSSALFLALLGVAGGPGGNIDRFRFQCWLRAMHNSRDYAPRRIVRTGTIKHAGKWMLVKD
jgi:hypothetical protein